MVVAAGTEEVVDMEAVVEVAAGDTEAAAAGRRKPELVCYRLSGVDTSL